MERAFSSYKCLTFSFENCRLPLLNSNALVIKPALIVFSHKNSYAAPSVVFRNQTALLRGTISTHLPLFCPKNSHSAATIGSSLPCTTSDTYFTFLKPYLQSEWQPILSGWICSAISVFSISKIVPLVGKLPAMMNIDNLNSLRNDGLILGVLVLARIVANYFQHALLWEAALNCVYKIRVHVFNRVLARDMDFFEGGKGIAPGDVAHRITTESSDVADTVYSLLNTIIPTTLHISTIATQMLVLSRALSLISALVIPSMALIVGCLGEKLRKISNEAHLSTASLSAYLNEIFPSILFVKANSAESCEQRRFQSLAFTDLSACLKKKQMKVLIPQIVQSMFFGLLLSFCIGSMIISRGLLDSASLVSFVTYLVLLIEPIQGIGKTYNELKQGEPAIERLFDLARFPSQVMEISDATELHSVAGKVEFSGLTFSYGDSTSLVVNDLNLCISAGETIALVGPSGGGKTTLAKLLLRLYNPRFGSILIDGHDIKNIRTESLRRHVGLVSQDTVLFSGTIAENIGYRDLINGIDMGKVESAARTANADEFIRKLPHQYQTNVGPRGSNFSGGQRQRLAIARAIYQNPSILILDEATSALDSKSELLVRQALQRLLENRTVLVIAHRLETVLMADRIFLLNEGKLQELSHSALQDDRHGSLPSTSLIAL